jgi:hypothetical protein
LLADLGLLAFGLRRDESSAPCDVASVEADRERADDPCAASCIGGSFTIGLGLEELEVGVAERDLLIALAWLGAEYVRQLLCLLQLGIEIGLFVR